MAIKCALKSLKGISPGIMHSDDRPITTGQGVTPQRRDTVSFAADYLLNSNAAVTLAATGFEGFYKIGI